MKRAAIIIAMLGIATWGLAQSNGKPAGQNAPAGQAAAPAGKRPPQAKTQDEFAAYKAAVAAGDLTDAEKLQAQKDPSVAAKLQADATVRQEKAADDFAIKYPDSELRAL